MQMASNYGWEITGDRVWMRYRTNWNRASPFGSSRTYTKTINYNVPGRRLWGLKEFSEILVLS